ncbi:MAG: hypothetical protein AB3N23_15525 [Paracoccaceae bacterium]
MLRELVSMAVAAGRHVQIMRWDNGLAAFSTEDLLSRFPDIADGWHPILRLAAGHWGRERLVRWMAENRDPAHMLIGEVPIIGNRYSEFVAKRDDDVEAALRSEATEFFYAVPTAELRAEQEAMRRATFESPRHPDEAKDAPPSTMELAWQWTYEKAVELDLVSGTQHTGVVPYDEKAYRLFFDHLLRHRNARALRFDQVYDFAGSAHELGAGISEIMALPDEVERAIEHVQSVFTPEQAAQKVREWYRV